MRTHAFTTAALVAALLVAADCAALPPAIDPGCHEQERLVWGHTFWSHDAASRATHINANTHHVFALGMVPPGRVLRMRSISLSTRYGGEADYMIELLVNVPGGHHYHRIAGGPARGTPALHVDPASAGALVLVEGEGLAGRALGGTEESMGILLLWSGWSYPAECLSKAVRDAAQLAELAHEMERREEARR
jgi:hypothetical protein